MGPRCALTSDSAYHLIEDPKKYLSNKESLAEEYLKIAKGIKSRLEQTVQAESKPANMNYGGDSTPKHL